MGEGGRRSRGRIPKHWWKRCWNCERMSRPPVCWIFAAAPAVSRRRCSCAPVRCHRCRAGTFAGSNGLSPAEPNVTLPSWSASPGMRRRTCWRNCCTGSSTSSPVTRPISPQQIWSSFSRKSPVNRKPPCSAAPTGWTSTRSRLPCGNRHSGRLAGLCMRWEQDRHRTWEAILQENGYAQVHTVPDLTGIANASCWGSGRNFGMVAAGCGNQFSKIC